MKFLMENEVGFDVQELGFPSIQGCIAIVYQTANGLYGYHSAGGSAPDKWQGRAQRFKDFVQATGGTAGGTRLYGVSFIGTNQRGYSGPARTAWTNELKAYADELGYTGKISGYDLSKSIKGGASAYVEYQKNGSKCDVSVREWTHAESTSKPTRQVNPDVLQHRNIITRSGGVVTLENIPTTVTGVSRTGLKKISKEQLR